MTARGPDPLANTPTVVIGQIQKLCWQLVNPTPAPAPGLHLSRAECAHVEEYTGLGTTRSPEEFTRAVGRLASIRIGDIRIPFTPGQLSELQYRAHKRGRSVEEEMKAVVARIQDELFYKGG